MLSNLENTIRGTRGNLLEQIPAEKVIRPKGFYKSIAIDFLTVASAFYFGYSANNFLQTGGVVALSFGVFPLLLFSSLEVILTKSLLRRVFVLVLETIAILSFFLNEQIFYLAVAGGIFLVFSLWGEILSRSEILNCIEVRFLKSTFPLLNKTMTALAFIVIIFYLPHWDSKNIFISKPAFGGIFTFSTGFIHDFYPEINFNSSVNDLAKQITIYNLTGTHPYEDLPAPAQKTLLNEILSQTQEQLRKFLGSNLSGEETLRDVSYDLVLKSLVNWREQFGGWFIAAWLAVLFLIARSFGAIIIWLSALVSLLVYQLLMALNFIAIRGESTTKETVKFV